MTFFFLTFTLSLFAEVRWHIEDRAADVSTIRADLVKILQVANSDSEGTAQKKLLPLIIDLVLDEKKPSKKNVVTISCEKKRVLLQVQARPSEWSSTFYYGLRKLGFLFPHPRVQISPQLRDVRTHCGRKYVWKPVLRHRGFHLHTQHPSEWVAGFLMGEDQIAEDYIRWLARNQQNLLQVVLLNSISGQVPGSLNRQFQRARLFGINTGLSISYAFGQQRSHTLFKKWEILLTFFGFNLTRKLEGRLNQFLRQFDSDFVTFELGTSEFTKTKERSTLLWLDITRKVLVKAGRQMFVKIHVPVHQKNDDGSNFNFLPEKADVAVGVLPHTVMFYSLLDKATPVYGRKDFIDMREFTQRNARLRPTLYFPETSYFVAFDIDVPLLLTDYLKARNEDMAFLQKNKIEGQLNFTTGQELGYWLFDWQVALSNDVDLVSDPMASLKLLGESEKVWRKIMDFQTKHFKDKQLIRVLSSSTILDEVGMFSPPHERVPFTQIEKHPGVGAEILLLGQAIVDRPEIDGVKNQELKSLLKVTWARMEHALLLRKAVVEKGQKSKRELLDQAKQIRLNALKIMQEIELKFNRYPRSELFSENENITSYGFGYAWPAVNLHFWQREEEMIRGQKYYPWFRNIYNPIRFLF